MGIEPPVACPAERGLGLRSALGPASGRAGGWLALGARWAGRAGGRGLRRKFKKGLPVGQKFKISDVRKKKYIYYWSKILLILLVIYWLKMFLLLVIYWLKMFLLFKATHHAGFNSSWLAPLFFFLFF